MQLGRIYSRKAARGAEFAPPRLDRARAEVSKGLLLVVGVGPGFTALLPRVKQQNANLKHNVYVIWPNTGIPCNSPSHV